MLRKKTWLIDNYLTFGLIQQHFFLGNSFLFQWLWVFMIFLWVNSGSRNTEMHYNYVKNIYQSMLISFKSHAKLLEWRDLSWEAPINHWPLACSTTLPPPSHLPPPPPSSNRVPSATTCSDAVINELVSINVAFLCYWRFCHLLL